MKPCFMFFAGNVTVPATFSIYLSFYFFYLWGENSLTIQSVQIPVSIETEVFPRTENRTIWFVATQWQI